MTDVCPDAALDVPASASRRRFLLAAGALALAGGVVGTAAGSLVPAAAEAAARSLPRRADVVAEFAGRTPRKFGMFLHHVLTHGHHRVALTFDACGGPRGSGYDAAIIATLRKRHVPATLFLNARWIAAHRSLAAELAADPLFEIGNHGSRHCPLTVRGQSAYGIAGTRSVGEAYDEIVAGSDAVAELTGSRPRWFRPGTAWADDVGIAIARRLGVTVVAFSINADAGATASKKAVTRNLRRAHSTDITLAHVNQPHGKTAEGLASALPKLQHAGRHFATLSRALA